VTYAQKNVYHYKHLLLRPARKAPPLKEQKTSTPPCTHLRQTTLEGKKMMHTIANTSKRGPRARHPHSSHTNQKICVCREMNSELTLAGEKNAYHYKHLQVWPACKAPPLVTQEPKDIRASSHTLETDDHELN